MEADAAPRNPLRIDELRRRTAAEMPRVRTDLERLVRIPSIAFEGYPREPVDEAAHAVAGILEDAGLSGVRLLDIPNGPHAVYGERPAAPGARTVLLYAHYDVQPAGPASEWSSPPFEPMERDGRLYGRGAADNKSGVALHAGALRALGADCRAGIKVLVEGEEEAGFGTLEGWVSAHPEMVQADLIVIADVGNRALGEPTLTTSLRGLAQVTVQVSTLHGPVHSGSYGGAAPDALVALIRMLATMYAEDGGVAVPGLEAAPWDGVENEEAAFRANAGVLDGVALIGHGSISERVCAQPSITVIGLDAPAVAGASNAVVPTARACVSARVAPGQDPRAVSRALRRHLSAVAPWNVHVRVSEGPVGEGFLADTSGPGYRATEDALGVAFGRAAVHRGEGGSIPLVAAFAKTVPAAEIVLFGAEEPQSRIHSSNESVDLGELERCLLTEMILIDQLGHANA